MTTSSATCRTAAYVYEYSWLLLPAFITILLIAAYKLTHISIIPGQPNTVLLLLPEEKGIRPSHPFSTVLSPFSYIRGRLAWNRLAASRGVSPRELAKQIYDEEDFDWAKGERPKHGTLVRGWNRVLVWDGDCVDLLKLESWRERSDLPADDVLDAISAEGPNTFDPLTRVADHKVKSQTSQEHRSDSAFLDFWKIADRRPPRGCGAVGIDWYRKNDAHCPEGLLGEVYTPVGALDYDSDDPFECLDSDDGFYAASNEELEEEARVLERGKAVFYRYGPPMMVSLLHAGLAGGFASPRIMSVLRATGYLVPPKGRSKGADAEQRLDENVNAVKEERKREESRSNHPMYAKPEEDENGDGLPSRATIERSFKRLLETLQFILDAVETADSLHPPSACLLRSFPTDGDDLVSRGGAGWIAATRVRFVHASIRSRLTKGNLSSSYMPASGVPINQEDLLATLCSFSIAPLWSLQRMGLTLSQQERSDYVALWRHIGYYMGIEPRMLRRTFRDVDSAERLLSCVASHHFLGVTSAKRLPPPPPISSFAGHDNLMEKPDKSSTAKIKFRGPALPLLYSVANRPPTAISFASHCAIARHLLGDALANAVDIPGMTTSQYLWMRIRLLVLIFPPLFARYYPRKGWGQALLCNCRTVLRRLIIWSAQGKQTSFEMKGERKVGIEEGRTVELNPEEGKKVRLEYWNLMKEAGAVLLLVSIILTAGFWMAFQALTHNWDALQAHACSIPS